jgi:hypothetical protein
MLRPNRYPGTNPQHDASFSPHAGAGSKPAGVPGSSPSSATAKIEPAAGPAHQMTPRARAELREQLRQEQLGSRRNRP